MNYNKKSYKEIIDDLFLEYKAIDNKKKMTIKNKRFKRISTKPKEYDFKYLENRNRIIDFIEKNVINRIEHFTIEFFQKLGYKEYCFELVPYQEIIDLLINNIESNNPFIRLFVIFEWFLFHQNKVFDSYKDKYNGKECANIVVQVFSDKSEYVAYTLKYLSIVLEKDGRIDDSEHNYLNSFFLSDNLYKIFTIKKYQLHSRLSILVKSKYFISCLQHVVIRNSSQYKLIQVFKEIITEYNDVEICKNLLKDYNNHDYDNNISNNKIIEKYNKDINCYTSANNIKNYNSYNKFNIYILNKNNRTYNFNNYYQNNSNNKNNNIDININLNNNKNKTNSFSRKLNNIILKTIFKFHFEKSNLSSLFFDVKSLALVCWGFFKVIPSCIIQIKGLVFHYFSIIDQVSFHPKYSLFVHNQMPITTNYHHIIKVTPYSKINNVLNNIEKLTIESQNDIYSFKNKSNLSINHNIYPSSQSLSKVSRIKLINHSVGCFQNRFLKGVNKNLIDYILIHCNSKITKFTYIINDPSIHSHYFSFDTSVIDLLVHYHKSTLQQIKISFTRFFNDQDNDDQIFNNQPISQLDENNSYCSSIITNKFQLYIQNLQKQILNSFDNRIDLLLFDSKLKKYKKINLSL
ncbi:hypothetical protein DICPUDRAFT_76175 [Dictyostelium purpureum]|uniref:Uncharacterized protein n=1 Tax=Dictyostelium purpureum TaxID=5786 RepID=F0ZCU3_DICPU|nr:uncharacterized protein DICPUDRAFT_76175 [Dictyostelium purpureum]EGC38199.1 hypothetical protein DICPUDRAFT_76175 [Dictyostelium purpureum]|eukprot:XP_003285237.1 hypothetical protein DICPUDRAFT_76175 [Dictyostelium purpureum]